VGPIILGALLLGPELLGPGPGPFDDEITAGKHDRFVAVIEPDEVRRCPIGAPYLKDQSVPVRGLDRGPPDDDAVPCDCLHGHHLYPY